MDEIHQLENSIRYLALISPPEELLEEIKPHLLSIILDNSLADSLRSDARKILQHIELGTK